MKKFLLFIMVLFGSMSTMSLADPCSTAYCQCVGGGTVNFGQYCQAKESVSSPQPREDLLQTYLFITDGIDYELIDLGMLYDSEAYHTYRDMCDPIYSEKLVCTSIRKPKNYLFVISSDDGRLFISADNSKGAAQKTAMKWCRKGNGVNCTVELIVSSELKLLDKRNNKEKILSVGGGRKKLW